MPLKITRVKKVLNFELPLEKAYLSHSEKVLIVASTHGPKQTDITYRGRNISVAASAYVRPTENETKRLHKKHGDKKAVR